MSHYQISPHIYLEYFEEDAVLLVADQDFMVTVNHAGAQLRGGFVVRTGGRRE